MTQRRENTHGGVMPSLRAKAQQFIDGITPGELAQLRALQTGDSSDALAPSLRVKLDRSVQGLTAEEATQLGSLLERAGVTARAGAEGDTQGYMRSQQQEYDTQGKVGGSLDQYTLGQIGIGFLGFVSSVAALGTPGSTGGTP